MYAIIKLQIGCELSLDPIVLPASSFSLKNPPKTDFGAREVCVTTTWSEDVTRGPLL